MCWNQQMGTQIPATIFYLYSNPLEYQSTKDVPVARPKAILNALIQF